MNKIECIRHNIKEVQYAIWQYENCSFDIYNIFASEEIINEKIRQSMTNIIEKCGFSKTGLNNIPLGEESRFFSRIDLNKLKIEMERAVKKDCENVKFISFEEFKLL